MADCVFCMIRDGKIPSAKVYDDQRTLAFMDINPLSRGHCLVVASLAASCSGRERHGPHNRSLSATQF